MTKLSLVILACGFSAPSVAAVSKSWSLNTGKKHPLFQTGDSVESLEVKVFSKEVGFEERWKLVGQVAGLKDKDASLSFLRRCLRSNEWFLQSAALKVLKKSHPDRAIPLAEKILLTSNALVVRSEAVSVISALGGPKDTDKLWVALNQRHNFKRRTSLWIRPQIVKSILKMERSKRSKKWVKLLSDSNEEIRGIAKKVLSVK